MFGTEFFSSPFLIGFEKNDMYRILAAYDGTVVTVNDGIVSNSYRMDAGQFQELKAEQGLHIISNLPVSVMQYWLSEGYLGWSGGPLQMQLLPASADKNSYRLYTPSTGLGIAGAIIIAPSQAITSISVNGKPDVDKNGNLIELGHFYPSPGGTHHYAFVRLPAGQSIIKSDLFPIWGVALAVATLGCYYRQRGPCSVCGRGAIIQLSNELRSH